MEREELLKLINDDDLGLLNVKSKASSGATTDERLVASFQEINDFIRQRGKEPQANKNDVREMRLYSRLDGLRENVDKVSEPLGDYDEFGLLGQRKPVSSINDIFTDDDLGLLEDAAESIFTLKHVPAKEITMPDYIARRKPCNEFANFEPLFKQCHSDLSAGKRMLSKFSQGSQINKGDFFVLKGVLVYVADEGERHPTFDGTYNARLRCIFDNGTESDLLLRSLAAALYEDGRRVSTSVDKLVSTVSGVTDEDQQTGYIYVLKSQSDRPEIKSLKHLYKIGFSRIAVEERIRNAAQEPTYLMAPVTVVTAYQCYNLNAQKLELLLHTFFASVCLNVDVFDANGRRYVPREWFVAPLAVIMQAIELLKSGEIVNYRYDPNRQEIVER